MNFPAKLHTQASSFRETPRFCKDPIAESRTSVIRYKVKPMWASGQGRRSFSMETLGIISSAEINLTWDYSNINRPKEREEKHKARLQLTYGPWKQALHQAVSPITLLFEHHTIFHEEV